MVNVYSQDGKIVLRNGKVATSNSCCCGVAPDCIGFCYGWSIFDNYTITITSNMGNYILQGPGDVWYNPELGIYVSLVCATYVPCGEGEEDVGAYAEIYFGFYPNQTIGTAILGRAKEPNCNAGGNLNNKTFNIFSCDNSVTGTIKFTVP